MNIDLGPVLSCPLLGGSCTKNEHAIFPSSSINSALQWVSLELSVAVLVLVEKRGQEAANRGDRIWYVTLLLDSSPPSAFTYPFLPSPAQFCPLQEELDVQNAHWLSTPCAISGHFTIAEVTSSVTAHSGQQLNSGYKKEIFIQNITQLLGCSTIWTKSY